MDRVAEPELMLDAHQARAYASADFEEPHSRFIDLLKQRLIDLPPNGVALDLGCGPGDISFRFVRTFPQWSVDALDGSPAMLELGRRAAERSGLETRVRFHEASLPRDSAPSRSYDLIFSNSLLHHLRDPEVLWSSTRRWSRAATLVFVMDLIRPESRGRASDLVDRYAFSEPEILRTDFHNSLLAAYRPSEIRDQLREASLSHLEIEVVSDRHFIVWGPIPSVNQPDA
jgi:ubiquinone/menaquinone biosynthesis C-methylase UbiE